MARDIAIIGAGLSGLMTAILLAQRGYNVSVYEKRSHEDLSENTPQRSHDSGRAMSMDLSLRGIRALKKAQVFSQLESHAVFMKEKIFHLSNDKQFSRKDLYLSLYNSCLNYNNILFYFQHELIDISFSSRMLTFNNNKLLIYSSPDYVIAADGVNSRARNACEKLSGLDFSREPFSHHYKELAISAKHACALEFHAMHLWPRSGFMLVAQPNSDGSFTCALLLKPETFRDIDRNFGVLSFFRDHFSELVPLMPELEKDYASHSVNSFKIIKASQWSFAHWLLLIGDAAHGMTPFFGQGVNCSFEDSLMLIELLDLYNDDWHMATKHFNDARPGDALAINEMSEVNYPELSHNANINHIFDIRTIEKYLLNNFSYLYRSYHNYICFDSTPYKQAQNIKAIQMALLNDIAINKKTADKIDESYVTMRLNSYRKELAHVTGEKILDLNRHDEPSLVMTIQD
jgi:kynurenine 3-monooxygenase